MPGFPSVAFPTINWEIFIFGHYKSYQKAFSTSFMLRVKAYTNPVSVALTLEAHCAEIQAGLTAVGEPLASLAESNGFKVERINSTIIITAPLGKVTFTGNKNSTRISFASPTNPELQLFKELYADRISKLGLAEIIKWDPPRASTPLNQTRCEVVSCANISKNFSRLRLRGEFTNFKKHNAGLHFRFLFGPKGVEWPALDANGLTYWPGGISKWHRPVFTVRRISVDADWIDVDIALHEGGRITKWLDGIKTSDEIAINGPSGSKMPKAERMFLFGDETAMPAIMRIIENVSINTEVRATIALRDPEDLQKVTEDKRFQIVSVDMRDEHKLLNTLKERIDLINGSYLFFAAEKTQAAKAREFIRSSSVSVGTAKIAAYWTRNL